MVVVQLVDGEDVDEILGEQAAIGLGFQIVGRDVVLGAPAERVEESGCGVEPCRRSETSAPETGASCRRRGG